MAWVATAVGVAGASTLVSMKAGADAADDQAAAFGKSKAGIEMSTNRKIRGLSSQLTAVQHNKVGAENQLARDKAKASSDAMVQAAVSGTEGASVDATQTFLDLDTVREVSNINFSYEQDVAQIRENRIQLSLDSDAQVGHFTSNSPSNLQNLAQLGLSMGGAYAGAKMGTASRKT